MTLATRPRIIQTGAPALEQRQRLLEQEAMQAPGRKVEATAPATILVQESNATADVGNGIVAQSQSPVAQQDPVYQRWESIGKAASWKPEEYE